MHKRRDGQPHKGWKASARARLLDTSSLVAVPCEPGEVGLCECPACMPVTTSTIDVDRVYSDDELRAYLDTLPRAQWAHADVMLRTMRGVPKERAVALAKAWLRRALLNVPRQYGATLYAFPTKADRPTA